ncbi:MAG: NDP-sugar synthase, partial [Nitriliruptoraceae bacterium]
MTPVRDAMIVAGGAGTRLHPLTATTPKPLLPFCNAPFLQGVIERLATQGIERVVLVVGADITPFRSLTDRAATQGVTVTCVAEPEPLDTAGGVREALDLVGDTFLVLNGDVLTDLDVRTAVDAHVRSRADATIVLTRVEDTSTFGVCVRDGTRIVDFVEKPAPGTLPGQDTVNAGTYVLERRALETFPRGSLSFERTVFPTLVSGGAHVEGFVSSAVWTDLGTPERLRDGHRRVLDGELDWPTLAAHRRVLHMAGDGAEVHGD